MEKEKQISSNELESLAASLAQTFIQRCDVYPRQLGDGSYICIHKPLTKNHILAHLRGDITIGVYLLNPESQARFIVLDADNQNQMDSLFFIAHALAAVDVPNYLECSRRGGHLWLFFDTPVSGKDARTFGHGLLAAHGLPGIELYPKQDSLKDGPGSLIRLPFGVHRLDGKRYGFISPCGQPLAPRLRDQIPLFFNPQVVPEAFFNCYLTEASAQVEQPEFQAIKAQGETLSQTIKDSITVYEFIIQYIELSPTGLGHCPFHDDKHKSFAVNIEMNYWHCFAGCGSGSVIDFWMMWQGCDFTTTIRELAKMLF